jgi:predicted metal-dependent enzyme (double-stranded beta helix superfamily)
MTASRSEWSTAEGTQIGGEPCAGTTRSAAAVEAARALHPSASGAQVLDSSVLTAIAGGLASVVDRQEAPSGQVRRVRLLETDAYDAWLLVWGPGAVADSHDHAGSVSVISVVSGSLTESAADIDAIPTDTRTIRSGRTTTLSATARHTLTNRNSGSSLSVHVFSPPLGDPDD